MRRAFSARFGTLDGNDRRIVALSLDQTPAKLLPACHRLAVDCDDDITGAQSGCAGSTAHRRVRQQRPLSRDARNVGAGKQQYGEQQIRNRTRRDDRDPFPDILTVERARQVRRIDGAFALVDHLHVAAERHGGKRPFGIVRAASARPDHAPEAD